MDEYQHLRESADADLGNVTPASFSYSDSEHHTIWVAAGETVEVTVERDFDDDVADRDTVVRLDREGATALRDLLNRWLA